MKLRAKINQLKTEFRQVTLLIEAVCDPSDLESLEKYLDKDLDIELKLHRNRRSLDANACLWACIHDLASALHTDNWTMYLAELRAYGQFVHIEMLEDAFDEFRTQWRTVDVVGEKEVEIPETYQEYDEETGEPVLIRTYTTKKMLSVNCYYGSHLYDTKEFSVLLDGVINDMKAIGLETPPSEEMRRMLEEMEKREAKKNGKDPTDVQGL